MENITAKNLIKFQQDYRNKNVVKKDRPFLKLERNLIRIKSQRNYF